MEKSLRIAVASGKGGTGKTTVATSLAATLARSGRDVCFVDADVEAPNGHLFLKPEIHTEHRVRLPVPEVNAELCDGKGLCAELCQYGAIICVGSRAVVLPDLCHGCGGCALVCPQKAIRERPREIGTVSVGKARSGNQTSAIDFVGGRLDIGQPLAPPVIAATRRRATPGRLQIIDAPPGTSCPTVNSVGDVDAALLVTEPTPFGLHDLQLATEMVRLLNVPFAVAVNRAEEGADEVRTWCRYQGIALLAELPHDRRVAEACARGEITVEALPEYIPAYEELWRRIEELAA